jgi:phenylacetyl-CoA:acceptor oxidoreductase subunit 2
VFFNPRRSWMSREALAAVLLVPATVGAALGVQACGAIAGAVALAFLFCQARILSAARGIPAWREPMLVPLILATGLTEGAGLLFALEPWLHAGSRSLLALFGALVLARLVAWLAYRRRVAPAAAAQALRTLDRAGAVLQYAGTLPPLVLVALVAAGAITGTATEAVAAVAGASAVFAGAFFKVVLVTQAGHTQAVALPHLPVRGRRVEMG